MTKFKSLCFVLAIMAASVLWPCASRGQVIISTITFTNTPADGNTLIIGGTTRTFKTTVTSAATQIFTGTNNNSACADTYLQLGAFPIASTAVQQTASNVLQIISSGSTVTFTGSWGTVTNLTNATTGLRPFTVPLASIPSSAEAIAEASLAVAGIDAFTTNGFKTNSPAMTNFVGLATPQTVGNKVFTNSAMNGGTNNGVLNTNGAFYGAAIEPATDLATTDITVFQIGSDPGGTFDSVPFVLVWDHVAQTLRLLSSVGGDPLLLQANIDGKFTGTLGGDGSTIVNIPESGVTNLTNDLANRVVKTNGTAVSLTTTGTNSLGGAIAGTKFLNSGLASGINQDINVGTNLAIELSGPAGAFTNAGFVAGVDQQLLIVKYRGAQAMSFISQSGSESTPANRLNFGPTGTTFTQTTNPCVSTWQYSTATTSWDLISHN